MRQDTVKPVSITMPAKLAQRLRVLAAQQDKSRSRFVCEVLEKALPIPDTQAENTAQAQAVAQ